MDRFQPFLTVNLTKDEQRKQNIISCISDRFTALEGFVRERVSVAYLDNDYIKRKDDNGVIEKVEGPQGLHLVTPNKTCM